MEEKIDRYNTTIYKGETIVNELLINPLRSLRELAKNCGFGKQRFWNHKRKLEKNNAIWGYTAVVDEEKIGWKLFVMLCKGKPLTTEYADLILHRINKITLNELAVRVIDFYYVSGTYDWINVFAAKDWKTARQYYDKLRAIYGDYYVEKPELMDVMFPIVKNGKVNPGVNRLREFVPPGL